MTAIALVQLFAQLLWVVLGVVAIARAAQRPTRTDRDIALFFGAIALVTIEGRLAQAVSLPPWTSVVSLVFVMALPYISVRLAHDFAGVATWIRRAAEVGFLISAAIILVSGTTRVTGLVFLVLYFVAAAAYSAVRFTAAAARSHGVAKQRMRLVAAGSYFLGLAILIAGVGVIEPAFLDVTGVVTQVCALLSAGSYALGLIPPAALKQYWQLPELRSLLARASILPRATTREIVDDISTVAGRALGARATIGLWDEERNVLRFQDPHGALPTEMGPGDFLAWRSFESCSAMYVPDVARANPANAANYAKANVGPVLIAPISAGERRLGVIEVYAPREPIFAEDDLAFVELIAQQAAILLESRQLIDDAARVRAQEEATRLKEDFVSAAAHDLKTPLTTIVAQAQLLERRAEREGRTSELAGIRRLTRETSQLSRLVEELLDASRIDRGAFPLQPESGDLVAVAQEVARRERAGAGRIRVEVDGPLCGQFDPQRMRQLIDNLLENALKYSPADAPVALRVWREGEQGRLSVTDHGIGIPVADLPHVFDRFRRGSNVDHRTAPGIGLGLYICRGIAEQHGGRIWAESEMGQGTAFHVALPIREAADQPTVDARAAAS